MTLPVQQSSRVPGKEHGGGERGSSTREKSTGQELKAWEYMCDLVDGILLAILDSLIKYTEI